MEITIDTTSVLGGGLQNPLAIAWWIFLNGGWIAILILFIVGLYIAKLEMARHKYRNSKEQILLALDIPRMHEQTLVAVEQIFAQLYAIHSKGNKYERYWKGKVQERFSLELVSIDGYIQYLIRSDKDNRDLIESAIYAQYPDAEITEVGDYTDSIPTVFPSDVFDLWGTEFTLEKKEAYPIRTYKNFEHTLSQTFADPMASILEGLSRLQPGEQTWIQIVITPVSSSWTESADRVVKKLVGEKVAPKKSAFGVLSPITDTLKGFGDEASNQILGGGTSTVKSEPDKQPKSQMQFLTPGARGAVEAIQEKMSKIAFRTKIRLIYVAKKEIFDRKRGVNPVIGGLMQYNTLNLNAFKPHKRTRTKADYIRVEKRLAHKQRKILRAYKQRANHLGMGLGFILNIEELASIYHFPIATITVPPVQRTDVRKGGAPTTLPRESMSTTGIPTLPNQKSEVGYTATRPMSRAGVPGNLPIEIINDEEPTNAESQ
ncbi:MAG: hypothetical protein WCW66_01475 [Patescibacteria group bacterium]